PVPQAAVELPGRGQVAAERLLDDDPPPATAFLGGQPGLAQSAGGGGEQVGGGGQVEQVVGFGAVVAVAAGQPLPQGAVRSRILQVSCQGIEPWLEPGPRGRIQRWRPQRAQVVGDLAAEILIRQRPAGDADNREILRQQLIACQVYQGG